MKIRWLALALLLAPVDSSGDLVGWGTDSAGNRRGFTLTRLEN